MSGGRRTVLLRPLRDADLALLHDWLHAPHVAPWFGDPESWLNEARERKGAFRFIRHFIAWADERPSASASTIAAVMPASPEYAAFPPTTTYSIDYLIGFRRHVLEASSSTSIPRLQDDLHKPIRPNQR